MSKVYFCDIITNYTCDILETANDWGGGGVPGFTLFKNNIRFFNNRAKINHIFPDIVF